jgi:hypothetical protein
MVLHPIPVGCTAPTTQASAIFFSAETGTTIDLSWVRGDGDRLLIVCKTGSGPTDPARGTSYTANSAFTAGDDAGSSSYAVYDGTGTTVTVTGLTAGTIYYFEIWEYNTTGTCYKTTPEGGSHSTDCSSCNPIGPGGVYEEYLEIWFDANDLDADRIPEGASESGLTGGKLDVWADKSLYGRDATTPVTNGDDPIYTVSGHNNYPYLTYAGVTEMPALIAAFTRADETIFCVSQVDDNSNSTVYDAETINLRRLFSAVDPPFSDNHVSIANYGNAPPYALVANNAVLPGNPMISEAFFSVAADEELRVNQGTALTGDGGSQTVTRLTLGSPIASTTSALTGSISELILFAGKPNTAIDIIIHNYLSAKYDVGLAALDLYDEDDNGNGDYDHHVAGIGRLDAANIQHDAQGTGIVRILNASGLGNDEFLIWGHDDGTAAATETVDVPAPVQARFDQV